MYIKIGSIAFSVFVITAAFIGRSIHLKNINTGAPPYEIEDLKPPENIDPYEWITSWERPDVPPRVGLQAGHWKNVEFPDELERLRGNTGSSGGGKWEWEVNLAIAEEAKKLLEPHGVTVDILPATVPVDYWADVFISIHADGSEDTGKSGFKVAAPRRDYSGNATTLVTLLQESYSSATALPLDDNVSRNMTGYYAFAWWRYDHAVHPRTASAILETGFLTNAHDRRTIIGQPEKSAQGISSAVLLYLKAQKLI